MASTYTTDNRLELMATGENSNTWGSKTNTNITLLEQKISGYLAVAIVDGNNTLSANNGATDQTRQAILKLTGALTTATTVITPAVANNWTIVNATTGSQTVTFKPSGGTGLVVPNDGIGHFYWTDGATMFYTTGPADITCTTLSATGAITGGSVATSSATITGGTISGVTITGNGAIPAGTILDFAGTAAPSGYLGCDGSAVSRATYAVLFAAISTTWGSGNGSTTFNVPDMRAQVAVGSGTSPTYGALAGGTVGATFGEFNHTLTTPEISSHSHTITDPTHAHTMSTGAGGGATIGYAGYSPSCLADATGSAASTGITGTNSAGGSGAHNNVQPSAVVLKIIKT
jgi:microcystin-dependent protein